MRHAKLIGLGLVIFIPLTWVLITLMQDNLAAKKAESDKVITTMRLVALRDELTSEYQAAMAVRNNKIAVDKKLQELGKTGRDDYADMVELAKQSGQLSERFEKIRASYEAHMTEQGCLYGDAEDHRPKELRSLPCLLPSPYQDLATSNQ